MRITINSLVVLLLVISCDRRSDLIEENLSWADSIQLKALQMMEKHPDSTVIDFLDSAYATKPQTSNREIWRKYATKVNYYQYYDSDPSKRKIYVDSMLHVSSVDKELTPHEYSNSLFAMATLLQEQKEYDQSFAYYYQGKTFAKGTVDSCSMSEFDNALGVIRYRQERYRQAIPHLKNALKDILACDKHDFKYGFIQHQSILNSIALSFEKSGQLDSAVSYYRKALSFVESHIGEHPGNESMVLVAKAIIEGNLGGAYAIKGDADLAEKFLKSNILFNDRPGYGIEDAQTAKLKLARLYLQQNKLHDAKTIIDQLEIDLTSERGKSSSHNEVKNRWLGLKSQYYEASGDFANALTFARRYSASKDSLDFNYRALKEVDVDQLLKEQHEQFTLDLVRKDSELKTAYLLALSFFFAAAVIVAISLLLSFRRSKRNVQELKSLNGQMKLALSALEISQQENTRLIKIVAHDLRGPIGAMTAMADLLLSESDRTAEDTEVLQMIKQTGSHSLDLVNNLMHFEHKKGKKITKELVNLGSLAKQCATMLSHKAWEKQQQFKLDLKDVELYLNYEKMWRVVSNLITNAIKFSPRGARIHLAISCDQQFVRLSIRDEGIGIPEGVGDSIFESFTEARRKGTDGEESFGLGLSITKQLVTAQGGRIFYESTPGQGTTFVVEFSILPQVREALP